mgnify:CR=1 FL=1
MVEKLNVGFSRNTSFAQWHFSMDLKYGAITFLSLLGKSSKMSKHVSYRQVKIQILDMHLLKIESLANEVLA